MILIDDRTGKLYLVFEFIDRTLLEVLEHKTNGLDVSTIIEYKVLFRLKL
jgi:hypothetical protein